MSGASSVLSPKQPGLVIGNIKCITNSNERAIGFFEVAAVSSKRIYLNFDDIFLGDPYPPYYCKCEPQNPPPDDFLKFCFKGPNCEGEAIILSLNGHDMVYVHHHGISYLLLPIACGDCTAIGSNIKPSFWVD